MNDVLSFPAQLLNTIEQSVIATDLDGIVIYWNRFAEHLYGWSAAEATGRNIIELVSPQPSLQEAEQIMAQLRRSKSWTGEFIARRKDGTSFPIQSVNSPIYDDNGTLVGIVGISHDITERKKTEKALVESENKYRTLLGQASDGIHTYDFQGNFLEVNSKLCEMLGYTSEELMRLNVKDLITPEDLTADPIRFDELRAGNTLLRERRLIRKDGTLFPAEISGTMIKDGVLQAIIRDVTERKRADEALRNRENQLRLITDAIPLLISYVDRKHRYRFVNRSYTEWFGKSREEVVDKHLSEVLGEAAYQSLLPEVETVLSGTEVVFERLVPYKSGERFIRVNYIPEFASLTGEVKGFHAFVQDISESKRAEEALRKSEEWLRSIFEASRDGIVVEDDGKIIYVNESYVRLFGYDAPEELINQPVALVISPEDTERVLDFGKRRLRGELPPSEYEFKGKRKDETLIEVEASVSITVIAEQTYITTMIRDISERKRAERLLEAQKQSLELVVKGVPLVEVLTYLAQVVEQQAEGGAIASILMLDEHGRLRNGASPSLPQHYLQKIEGLKAEPHVGTCSAAAALGKIVVTPDIGADQKWNGLAHLPLELGLQAAWTMPISARDGRVLGTFGTYFRERREPTGLERQVVEILARTAALAIERKQDEDELRRSHKELEVRVRERTEDLQKANEALQTEIQERRQAEEARIEVLQQLVNAQEEERRRIARDLHDQLGQQLTVLRLNLELLKRMCRDAEMFEKIGEVQKVARQLDADVDFLAWEMRPSALDDLGIAAALDNYVRQWSKHFGTPAEFNADRFGKITLAHETETNLYRITQEALNNVSKHAKARGVNVLLEPRGNSLMLIIEDDGVGFEPNKHTLKEKGVSMGLIGMQERAALVGGTLEIESAEGKGTTIYAKVPILAFGNGEKE
ncbi:MAG TPA: PAS domain S-box protein [Pyrinomonadaceae bacterium]